MQKRYILFDLDGTLTDSREGIVNSIVHALEHYGIQVDDREVLRPFLGPPLAESFCKYFDFDKEQALEAVGYYREYFAVKGLLENQVYEGVEELVKNLQNSGYKLFLATSKPEVFAKQIMDHFGLSSYFTFIGGATLDESRLKKADVIRYVLEENQIADVSEVVMVGDRDQDVWGAKQNGIDVIGVLYGYGSREELEEAGADAIAAFPDDVLKILEKQW